MTPTTSFLKQWNKLQLVEACTPEIDPVSLLGSSMWDLDTKMRAEFSSVLAQYEQGLLHSMEMMEQLQQIISKEREL